MCGIFGVFNFKSGKELHPEPFEDVLSLIRHRGPDDAGALVDREFGVGMTRLSIIGLEDGAQPMTSADGRYAVVFNGEIYNYRDLRKSLSARGYPFKTHADTEVILALKSMGQERPEEKLRGMFAYALFDRERRSLELSRDRLGKKPLFWTETSDGIVFGSELKALLAWDSVEAQVDLNAISDFLTLSYVPGPQSPFKGIQQVLPGHTLSVGAGVRERPYWRLETMREEAKPHKTPAEWQEEVGEKLAEAVRYRLVADVPVGLFLSGGIDSALVLSLAVQSSPRFPVKTFTVGFDSTSYDESEAARLTARHLGVENVCIRLRPQDVEDHFERVVHCSDNLLANPAMYANYLLSATASRDVKVVLNGGGGDELFFGYPTYQATTVAGLIRRLPVFAFSAARMAVDRLPASHRKLSATYTARKFLEGANLGGERSHYWWRTIITESEKSSLLTGNAAPRDSYWCYERAYREYDGTNELEKYSFADLMVWWRSMGLYQADCMSMANSLEMRVPMMDHEFVELAYRIPTKLKYQFRVTKPLLKRVSAGVLPDELLKLKKQGFHIPLAEWFCDPLKDFVLTRLSEDRIRKVGFLDCAAVARILDEHFEKKADNSFKINNLLVLVEWYLQFAHG